MHEILRGRLRKRGQYLEIEVLVKPNEDKNARSWGLGGSPLHSWRRRLTTSSTCNHNDEIFGRKQVVNGFCDVHDRYWILIFETQAIVLVVDPNIASASLRGCSTADIYTVNFPVAQISNYITSSSWFAINHTRVLIICLEYFYYFH